MLENNVINARTEVTICYGCTYVTHMYSVSNPEFGEEVKFKQSP